MFELVSRGWLILLREDASANKLVEGKKGATSPRPSPPKAERERDRAAFRRLAPLIAAYRRLAVGGRRTSKLREQGAKVGWKLETARLFSLVLAYSLLFRRGARKAALPMAQWRGGAGRKGYTHLRHGFSRLLADALKPNQAYWRKRSSLIKGNQAYSRLFAVFLKKLCEVSFESTRGTVRWAGQRSPFALESQPFMA